MECDEKYSRRVREKRIKSAACSLHVMNVINLGFIVFS
jgi:hypothetical protein